MLQQRKWEKSSREDAVTRFQYAADQHQISAKAEQTSGPGWEASIDGQQAVSLMARQLGYYSTMINVTVFLMFPCSWYISMHRSSTKTSWNLWESPSQTLKERLRVDAFLPASCTRLSTLVQKRNEEKLP